MTIRRKDTDSGIYLKVEGELSIYEVGAFHEQLATCLENVRPLEIDLEGITGCDTAGLQLLCAAHKSAMKSNVRFQMVGAPQTVMETARSLGLNPKDIFADADGN